MICQLSNINNLIELSHTSQEPFVYCVRTENPANCHKSEVSHLSIGGEINKEADHTDDKDKVLTPHWCSKPLWKHSTHFGDKTLHKDKLGTH